jgi:hypothetical protein
MGHGMIKWQLAMFVEKQQEILRTTIEEQQRKPFDEIVYKTMASAISSGSLITQVKSDPSTLQISST